MPEVQGQKLYAALPAACVSHVRADIPDDGYGAAELAVNTHLLFDLDLGGGAKLHTVEGQVHACSSK